VGVLLLVGTRKGLFLLRSNDDRRNWELDGPLLTGWSVFHAMQDARDGDLYVAANNFVYGGTVQRSSDGGRTWKRSEGLGLPEETGLKLEEVWHVEPGHASEPDTLWLGATPGALFRSGDKGETWEPVMGLVQHETRDRWQPGAGGMCCHSIQIDPESPQTMYAAISAAGSFRTDDGGETWVPANNGVAADFMPDDPFPAVGQCVHKLLLHPERPDRLWQQNHCGVYRSDDRGDSWERLEQNGLPSGFGFPLALHPRDPDVAYVIPEEGAENRVTPNGELGVYRTSDGGATWTLLEDGLPKPAWGAVMREGFASDTRDPAGIYFGTQSGSVFVSTSEGTSWTEVARQLPPVLSVEVGEWS
jgi:photosystem II stability/assembly factor-like uncharacterized protein